MNTTLTKHPVTTRDQWLQARKELLAREKQATQLRDELAAERRKLPWLKLDKTYVFEGPAGKVTLGELFGRHSQLVVYHFMFGPDWQEGCPSCSFVADHFDGMGPHLAARDVTLAVVSHAPLTKLTAFKQRLGWRFPWVSSHGSDFNHDFGVSFSKDELAQGAVEYNYQRQEFPSEEAPGLSVFRKDETGAIYHTYSTYARGLEPLLGTYMMLDLVPKGRDEEGLDFTMAWVRYHDSYETNAFADADKPYWPEVEPAASGCGCAKQEAAR